MEKGIKDETQEVVFFSIRINKKQLRFGMIILTISVVAGALLFFLKHF